MIKKISLILIFIISLNTFINAMASSRIKTSLDFPSSYNLSTEVSGNLISDNYMSVDIGESFSFAYEQRFIKKKPDKKLTWYLGAEMMMGKSADIIMAFHSAYLMPIVSLKEHLNLSIRIGYTKLSADENLPVSSGYMFSFGPEFKISDKWMMHFSNTWYKITDQNYTVKTDPPPGATWEAVETDAKMGIDYNKFAVSIIYGFDKK